MTTILGRFPVRILGLAAGAVLIAGVMAPAADQKKERPKDAPEQCDDQGGQDRPRRERQRDRQSAEQDGGRPVEAIAKELGVTPEQFREAFKKVHPAGPGERPTDEQRQANRKALSEALNVSPEKLDEVMDKYRPGGRGENGPRGEQGARRGQGDRQGPPDGERRRPEPPFEKIASDLGVSVDAVKEAMKTFTRPEPGQRPNKEQRDANAKKLADALNLPIEKVTEVLEKNRPSPPPRREEEDGQQDGPPPRER